MNDVLKNIFLTLVHYVLDVIIWGSVIGLIYVLAHYISNILFETNYDLIVSYFKGLVSYWVIDTVLAKFRESYNAVKEMKNRKDK